MTPTPLADLTAPIVTLRLRFTKTGPFAVRRTGKFGLRTTLNEPATLAITVTARKNARAKARTILRTTRKNVASGTRTLTFALSRKVRATLTKGSIVKLTLKATDAAGNAKTQSVSAKVP